MTPENAHSNSQQAIPLCGSLREWYRYKTNDVNRLPVVLSDFNPKTIPHECWFPLHASCCPQNYFCMEFSPFLIATYCQVLKALHGHGSCILTIIIGYVQVE